jgi:hypothetical protein
MSSATRYSATKHNKENEKRPLFSGATTYQTVSALALAHREYRKADLTSAMRYIYLI